MRQCESCKYFKKLKLESAQGPLDAYHCTCPEEDDERYGESNFVLWGEQTEEDAENAGFGPESDKCQCYEPKENW